MGAGRHPAALSHRGDHVPSRRPEDSDPQLPVVCPQTGLLRRAGASDGPTNPWAPNTTQCGGARGPSDVHSRRPVGKQNHRRTPRRLSSRTTSARRAVSPGQSGASTSCASPVRAQAPVTPEPSRSTRSPVHASAAPPSPASRSSTSDWDPQQELCSVSPPPLTPGRSPAEEAGKHEAPVSSPSPSPVKPRRYKRIRVLEYVSDEDRD